MANARCFSCRLAGGLLLVLAVTLALSLTLKGQTTPTITHNSAAALPRLPTEIQAQLDKLHEALKATQAAGDARAEAKALNRIGDVFFRIPQYQKALDEYNQALTLASSAKDTQEGAAALNGIAGCYRGQGQNNKALEVFQQALDLAAASGDLRGQATALNGIGWVNEGLGEAQKSLDYQNKAFPLAQKANDEGLEAAILRRIGYAEGLLGEPQKALDSYNKALEINRRLGDRDAEARVLLNIGTLYHGQSEDQKALDYYGQALRISREVGDRAIEALVLMDAGVSHFRRSETEEALDSLNGALSIFRQLGDRAREATTLTDIGTAYNALGEKQKALDCFNQALPLKRAAGDRVGEAEELNNIGLMYEDLGKNRTALDNYSQARELFSALGDVDDAAQMTGAMGVVYRDLGELKKSLDAFNQALPVFVETKDRAFEARMLVNIGSVFYDMGEKQKAVEYFQRALPALRQTSNRDGEAMALNNIGYVYYDLGEFRKALDSYNEALPIWLALGDRSGEALALNDIGMAAHRLGEQQKALDYLNRALPICRQIGERNGEVRTLSNLGDVYRDLGETPTALNFYSQALPLATGMSNALMEASVFHSMMLVQQVRQPALAIFYGKLAVNLLQQVRGNIQGLDKELQKSFLSSNGDNYRDLADLMIAQGRLPEAQQVLDLLKEQEYSDYTRGETADTLNPLSLTPAEKQAEDDYQKSTAQIVALGEQWADLKKISSRTAEQEKQYQQLSDRLDAASKGLNDYYDRLYVLFGKNSEANKQLADVKGDVSLLEDQIAEVPHTVALYTMVTGDHYRVIVITATATVAREYAISDKDLNKKISDFQQVLRDPARDPRPLAQELYNILIAPVKADLDQAKAETLVWSLDGVLRYVPLAALFDGKRYLVEQYNTVTITPASIAHLGETPDESNLSAAAKGISRKYEDGLSALPAVVGELDDVVKDAKVQGANGALPGTILLDGQFTEKAMEDQLGGQHGVVHIASHFVFKPGDDSQSYLLLAGKDEGSAGFHLTVADFRDNRSLALRHTDLLTLSACETGMSGNSSNGREVDGLGTTAQMKGAKAVISSLWEVNDASTGELMGDFYKRWADGAGKVTKVEALRQAQLDLLLGRVTPQAGKTGRGFASAKPKQNVPAGYAHPYYWAPFVLMGNWR